MRNCKLCGANGLAVHQQTLQYMELVPEAQVCGKCADKIANAYNKAHSGRWLTWPNPPAQKPKKGVIPRALRKAVFERDGYRCKQCDGHVDLCADHIFPESKGGETTLDNLQTLCRSCNSKKGSRVLELEAA